MTVNDTTPPGGSKVGLLIAGDSPATFSPVARALVQACSAAARQSDLSFAIFCEDSESFAAASQTQISFVRSWKRSSGSYDELAAAITQRDISTLIVGAPLHSFNAKNFSELCDKLHAAGVNIVAICAADEMVDSGVAHFAPRLDAALCTTRVDQLAALAAGAAGGRVYRWQPGTLPIATRSDARAALAIEPAEQIVATLWSGAPDSGLESVVRMVEARRAAGHAIRLLVLRSDSRVVAAAESNRSFAYLAELKSRGCVLPANGCLEAVPMYLAAADLLVVTADKPLQEVSWAIRCALAVKLPVFSTAAAVVQEFAPSVVAPMAPFTLPMLVEAAFERSAFKDALRQTEWSGASVEQSTEQLLAVLRQLAVRPRKVTSASVPKVSNSAATRILLSWDSSDDIDEAGVCADALATALREHGVSVDLAADGSTSPEGYDLVHIFGSSPAMDTIAAEARRMAIPLVVSPRYRGISAVRARVETVAALLKRYVDGGQERGSLAGLTLDQIAEQPVATTMDGFSLISSTGATESALLKRDVSGIAEPTIVPVGADRLPAGDGGQLFRTRSGLQDFILCVGTIDPRNNQLGLLKALESCELPLVFISDGESPDEEYLSVCRRFKRAGQTKFFEALVPEFLASAYQAARVHVNAAWLPMPGVATLEAARAGTNVVATRGSSIVDYLGTLAYLCTPHDPADIYNAVLAAYYAPVRAGLSECASQFTWQSAGSQLLATYSKVLGRDLAAPAPVSRPAGDPIATAAPLVAESIQVASEHAKQASMSVGRIPAVMATNAPATNESAAQVKALCDDGDALLRSGDNTGGMAKYRAAIQLDPLFGRAHRSCGVAAIQLTRFDEAERYFSQALDLDPSDTKALIGIGSVLWERGEREKAFANYITAAEKNPQDPASILYLVHSAYALERLSDLEHALRRFLLSDANNVQIQYCLAGCYYRQGRTSLAKGVIERILHLNPGHEAALELRAHIEKEQGAPIEPAPKPAPAANGELRLSLQSPVAPAAKVDLAARRESIELAKKQKEYETAVSLCERLLEERSATPSDRAYAQIVKGEVLACQGETDEAMQLFTQAQSDTEWGFRALAGIGALRAASGSLNEAVAQFEKSIALNPQYDNAYAGLGVVASLQGAHDEAWQCYSTALAKNPSNLRALYGVIQLGYQLNRLDGTAKAIEGFLDEHPADLSILYSYAGCLYAQGDRNGALTQLNKILLFDKQHTLALELIQRIQDGGNGAPFGG